MYSYIMESSYFTEQTDKQVDYIGKWNVLAMLLEDTQDRDEGYLQPFRFVIE